MKRILLIFLLLVGLLAFVLSGVALAKVSAGEAIDWWVFGADGNLVTSGDLSLETTLGQTSIGAASNGNTQLESGFWYGMQTYTLNLPVVIK